MNHLSDDQLLLYGYGEVAEAERPGQEAHLAACGECRTRFTRLEESRVAVSWALERQPAKRALRLFWLSLPLAAGIGALLLLRPPDANVRPADVPAWKSTLVASPNAGYVTGSALMAIDSQLVRLEQGRTHGSLRN